MGTRFYIVLATAIMGWVLYFYTEYTHSLYKKMHESMMIMTSDCVKLVNEQSAIIEILKD